MRITLEIDNINFKNRVEQFRKGKFDVDLNFMFNDMTKERIIIRNGVCNDEKRLDDIVNGKLKSGIVEIDIIDSIAKRFYKEKVETTLKRRGIRRFSVLLEPKCDLFSSIPPNAYIISLYENGTVVLMRFKGLYIDFEPDKGLGEALSIIKSINNV